jgi:hypothetical protein
MTGGGDRRQDADATTARDDRKGRWERLAIACSSTVSAIEFSYST